MMYSVDIDKMCTTAMEIASNMNSTQVFPPHLVAAALKFGYVRNAADESGVDVGRLAAAVNDECEKCAKISVNTAARYKNANIERKMRLSIESQNVLLKANSLAEDNELWPTGWLEVSHIMMAIIGIGACKALDEHMNTTSAPRSDILNKFLDGIVEHESKERGIAPKSMTFSLSRNEDNESAPARTHSGKDISPLCRDMLSQAANDDKPFVGRVNEIAELMQCIERRDKPNAILTGPPGVGKTDIVRGLAKKIIDGDVPEQLKGINLYMIDIAGMVAGSEFRGSFEKKLKETIEAACKQERPILFIDEIHTVLGAGKTMDSSMDAANILKPYLTEGKIRVIGATTKDEYRKYVEKDPAFMRRFQEVNVSEPSTADTVKIIEGIKPAYETFHGVKINKDAIKRSVELSVKHMHDRFLPDKAIDIIDQTCARVKLEAGKKVTVADVETTVSNLCHIPVHNMQKDEMEKVRALDAKLKKVVFGQDTAIDTLAESVQMAKAGLGDETKPIGAFMFVGPSGVGKTEVAKQLANTLGIEFIRFDMSEYAEAHTIAKLIGSPAGYVGYDDGGILVEQIRQHPHAVVLFDEIEKAHPDIYKIFLQIFDYGMLSDNKGRKADFRNTVIIMTSNAGNTTAAKPRLGFGDVTAHDLKSSSMKAVSELMAPELRGRITATVVFNPLNDEISKKIVNKELNALAMKLKAKNITVEYSENAISEIVKRGISAQYGAREIQRTIDNNIKKMFVKKIVAGNAAGKYYIDVENGEFVLNEVLQVAAI